jgi:L-alanine-DL-glutamate epimerase-like enolase superfamily enzyme
VSVRLRSVEVIPYALPFREPYVTARGRLEQREMVLLRLRTEDGLVGLGEAVPLSLRGGVSLPDVVQELEELAEGDSLPLFFEHTTLEVASVEEIDPRLRLSAPARCALFTAIDDLYGRYNESEAFERAPLPCNATLVGGAPEEVADSALRWAADGYTTFKLKLGTGADVAQVRAVREALGPEAKIRVDANAAWSLRTATAVLAELEPLGIEFAEQPVAGMEEAAQLARVTSIPLAGDESIVTPEDAERADATGAFQLAGIKISKVGGNYAGMLIGEALPSYVSSALDGPVGIASAAHLAGNVREFIWPGNSDRAHGLATQRLFASTIAAVECELRDGKLHPPPGPGLGVEIDEDALEFHRL